MKMLAALLVLTAFGSVAHTEDIWRWKDANGTLHYSNRPEVVPSDATRVTTPLTIETRALPGAPGLAVHGGTVVDVPEERRPPSVVPHTRLRPTYSEERRRFGCYAAGMLFAGNWSHPDDINVIGNCLPYMLGPEAWLNAARAELALRENGIDYKQVVPMYLGQRESLLPPRLTNVGQE